MNILPYLATALFVPAVIAPTQEVSDAERHLRDAWWAEQGANDLERALVLYQRAVAAEGPPNIRADASVRVGVMLHRLGRIEEALTALAAVSKDFPDADDAIRNARQLLDQLTAVDAISDYREWYRRQMFSETVQRAILQLIRELAAIDPRAQDLRGDRDRLRREILAYDRAALPALRETSLARSEGLAAVAMDLLARLNELPPPEAMASSTAWADHAVSWIRLLQMNTVERGKQTSGLRHRSDAVARLARSDVDGMLGIVASEAGGRMVLQGDHTPGAVLRAILAVGDAQVVGRVAALASDDRTPLAVRRLIEEVVAGCEWGGAEASDWLGFSRGRFSFEVRCAALSRAAQNLDAEDADTMDALLAEPDDSLQRHRSGVVAAIYYGLMENPIPLQLPWTSDRLKRVVLMVPSLYDGSAEFFHKFRMTEQGRQLLAQTLFSNPLTLVKAFDAEDAMSDLSMALSCGDSDDEESLAFENAWCAVVGDRVIGGWSNWSADERLAVARMIENGLALADVEQGAELRDFLRARAGDADAPTELTEILEGVVGAWN